MDVQYRAEKEKTEKYKILIDKIIYMCDTRENIPSVLLREFIEDNIKKI